MESLSIGLIPASNLPSDHFNWTRVDFQTVGSLLWIGRKRWTLARIEGAISDTRVVLISGPRQAGKTTLSIEIAGDFFC